MLVGNAKLLATHQVDLTAVATTASAHGAQRTLPSLLAVDGQLRACLVLAVMTCSKTRPRRPLLSCGRWVART